MHLVAADDDETHIRTPLIERLGEFHEDVEAANRLEAARGVGHELDMVGHDDAPRLSRLPGPRLPDVRIDAVEDYLDLVAVLRREPIALPVRRAIAGVAAV